MENLHQNIVSKIINHYKNAKALKTNNETLNTKIIFNICEIENLNQNIVFNKNEYPVVVCSLQNGNVFVATTERFISIYKNTFFSMIYSDFIEVDATYYKKSSDLFEGKTVILKYKTKKGEFIYEIDSLEPADLVHHYILSGMIIDKFKVNPLHPT